MRHDPVSPNYRRRRRSEVEADRERRAARRGTCLLVILGVVAVLGVGIAIGMFVF